MSNVYRILVCHELPSVPPTGQELFKGPDGFSQPEASWEQWPSLLTLLFSGWTLKEYSQHWWHGTLTVTTQLIQSGVETEAQEATGAGIEIR